jgi:hypothetical protein
MKSKNTIKMMIAMAACCLIPIIIIFAVSTLGIASGNRMLTAIVPFLCPILMIGMMIYMGAGMRNGHNHNAHSCCNGNTEEDNTVNKIEQRI